MSSIQTISDELLIEAIEKARQRVVLIAPGVWTPVAESVARAWRRLGAGSVTVILDVDPEICRIGYGSLEGLKILQQAATAVGEALGEEPGIRICVVIVDEQTFVFSPTPRQLEAPAGDSAVSGAPQPKGNGIVLAQPPAKLECDLGSGPDGDSSRTLGLEPVNRQKVEEVSADLEVNPPKKFDLARAVNVYNAKIQFVEFKVTGCRLSEHKARLPKHLLHVLKKNPDLSQKIENSIRLLEAGDALVTNPKLSQDTVFQRRASIAEKFLRTVKGIGTVIERSRKAEFAKEEEELTGEVVKFAERVKEELSNRFHETAKQLATELLPDVLADIPKKWKRQLGASADPEHVRFRIIEDLLHAFGNPDKKVGKMKVETVFKDVTYDMLTDPEFRKAISEHFPDLALMEEFAAAKERTDEGDHD